MRKKILVTGANGQLGMELQQLGESISWISNLFLPPVKNCRWTILMQSIDLFPNISHNTALTALPIQQLIKRNQKKS